MRRAILATAVAALLLVLSPPAAAQCADCEPGEANVIGVDWQTFQDGTTFWVTVNKDIEGYDGVADWWQVETLDGEVFGSDQVTQTEPEFTTNRTVAVPDGVRYAVVRAHDTEYGYGGQAFVVDLEGDSATAYNQGGNATTFASPTDDGGGNGGSGGSDEADSTGSVPVDPDVYRTVRGNLTVPDDDIRLPENVTGEGWRIPQVSPTAPWIPLLAVAILIAIVLAVHLRRR